MTEPKKKTSRGAMGCLVLVILGVWMGITGGVPLLGLILNFAGAALAVAFLVNAGFRDRMETIFIESRKIA